MQYRKNSITETTDLYDHENAPALMSNTIKHGAYIEWIDGVPKITTDYNHKIRSVIRYKALILMILVFLLLLGTNILLSFLK